MISAYFIYLSAQSLAREVQEEVVVVVGGCANRTEVRKKVMC